ncbi:hypothetical protein V5799_018551 [Amblyomma americanum]|uniref:RING-type domain-containing protein n=1 Tax=Amblyomma americanum TaxID=6943 RepID=A0AAQ4EZR5_AMBAM
MAPAITQTAFGFVSGLDWRPTCFVNPFPSTKVCSACCLVPPSAAMLPCRHTLCLSCYGGGAGTRNHCPVDKEPFQEEDVVWSTLSKDSILGRKVRCWNVDNGCDVVGAASAMLEHFDNACQFHVVMCSRRCKKVPHRSFAEHLEYECVPCRAREEPVDDNFANACMEVKEALGKILQVNASLQAKLDSIEERLCPETNGTLVALSTSTADAVTAALEDRISGFRSQTEGASTEYRGVRNALKKLSEENASVQAKLDSFEKRLDQGREVATLSTIVADALNAAVEKIGSACCLQSERALAGHRREVTSEIKGALAEYERVMKNMISQGCDRNVLEKKDRSAGGLRDERRMANAGPSLPEMSAKILTGPVEDEAAALQLLAIASSLSITSDFLNKSVPYEWTIDDWTAFCERAPASCEYFSGNDGQPSYHYGYLIVPRLCFDQCHIWLRAYVMKGLFDKFLKWPLEKTMRLCLEHHNDRRRQLIISSKFMPTKKQPLPGVREVLCVGVSRSVTVGELEERGLIEENKVRLRLDFVP